MEDLLIPVSSRKLVKEVDISKAPAPNPSFSDISDPESALQCLSSQPSSALFFQTLLYLSKTTSTTQDAGFNIIAPNAKAAQIIFVLVNDILPNFWPLLRDGTTAEEKKARSRLIRVLRSSAGFGALLAKLKAEIEETKAGGKAKLEGLQILLEVFEELLQGDEILLGLWNDVNHCETRPQRADLWWKEICLVIASGRIVSLVAEADDLLREQSKDLRRRSWIADASQYSAWLGRNVRFMLSGLQGGTWDLRARKGSALLLSRGLSLGYTDALIGEVFATLLRGDERSLPQVVGLLGVLQKFEQQSLLYSLVRILAKKPSSDKDAIISGAAALLSALCEDVPDRLESLQDWLVGSSPESIKYEPYLRRVVILALSRNTNSVKEVVWRALEQFMDKLYIKHAPIHHQEVNSQVILICLSHAHRRDASFLPSVSKSSAYLSGISNHLASSSPKVRFLGMIVGLAISEKIDEPGKRLKFTSDGFDQAEWDWYKGLLDLRDRIGSIAQLKVKGETQSTSKPGKAKQVQKSNVANAKRPTATTSKIVAIEEITDSESEDDDLPTYAKPDSDPSDDDEDPTLVQRNKPTAPVYIKDLVAGLLNTEDYDIHYLALKNAAGLIRRKAQFGSEVQDHIEDLASNTIGLKDRWELDDFNTLRMQAMLAVLLADPKTMGPYFTQLFYTGDLSLSQRGAILSCLGLAAREIAGVGADDRIVTGAEASKDAFPSKRLPSKLHDYYALDAAPTNTITTSLSRMLIQPLAADAADKISGPNALKVRTFSSRMDVEKKRTKPTSNKLAKIVAEAFFFPLTGRWQIQTQAVGADPPQASPMLLSQFLKTLALILHAAGPSTPALPQLTSEFWDLLLSLRVKADDQSVLEALLFAFMMILEVNGENERAVAIEHARELLETQEWVSGVLERIRGGEEESDRCRMLAAGVLVKCKEIVEKHQRLLLGDMIGYRD